jgi:hypothetical protein
MALEQSFGLQTGVFPDASDMTLPTSSCAYSRPSFASCHTSLAIPSQPFSVSPTLLTKTDTSTSSDFEENIRRTSLNGLITVIRYFPKEGDANTPMTIELLKSPQLTENASLKLVVGNKAVATLHVRGSRPARLVACIPELSKAHPVSNLGAPLRLDVVDRFTKITLDSCLFGWFTYWGQGELLLLLLPTAEP